MEYYPSSMLTTLALGISTTNVGICLASLAGLFSIWVMARGRKIPKGLRLPPGPSGNTLLGNLFDIPQRYEWETFTKWATEFGSLVYITVLGKNIVFVNTAETAHDLFEKRSALYSDRFNFPMMNELVGFDWNFGFMPYGERWRRHRKIFHQKFHPTSITTYHDVLTKQTRSLLQRLHESPDRFQEHLHHMTGAIIMEVVYGIKVLPSGDPYLGLVEKGFKAASVAGNPGAFLVNILPILKHVPEWVPGAGFQRQARIWREVVTQIPFVPFRAVKEALKAGTAEPCIISSLLEDLAHDTDSLEDEEEVIRNAGAVAYLAGSETTTSALKWFILAMVIHPTIQRKAQAELDSVIGSDRLPEFPDRENLPYINALCQEVQRWRPVVPLGIAHRLIEDDTYKDYFIPGGSIVVGNAWAILHDEKIYGPNPMDFEPERFLKPGVPDPTPAFGFGRRICPGRSMAEMTSFITIASIIKMFDILPVSNKHGSEVYPQVLSTSGFIVSPEPFRCIIRPRSAEAEKQLLHPDNGRYTCGDSHGRVSSGNIG